MQKKGRKLTKGTTWAQRLVEVAVIVGSILLAFAIEAGWDARKERIHESEVLAAIKQDMKANLLELKRVTSSFEIKESSIVSAKST